MTDFKFIQGSFYKRRDGKKVLCTGTDESSAYFIEADDPNNMPTDCRIKNGRLYEFVDHGDTKYDIISEWSEPRTGYVNIYRNTENGFIMSGNPQDTIEQCQDKSKPSIYNPTYVCIACSKYTEGQFDA